MWMEHMIAHLFLGPIYYQVLGIFTFDLDLVVLSKVVKYQKWDFKSWSLNSIG